jgi:hypothetical protein
MRRLVSVTGARWQRAPEHGFLLTLKAETYVFTPETDEIVSPRDLAEGLRELQARFDESERQ